MAARALATATALMLCLTGLAQGQAQPTWQEPGQARGATAPAAAAPESQAPAKQEPAQAKTDTSPAQAEPLQAKGEPQQAKAEPPRAEAARPRARAERRPRGYRSARYQGGSGASWRTGRDAYGFMGSYGGCSYRGHAGPGGYRLDRRC